MEDFIPVNEPILNGNEKKYLAECIESGWISSEGPFVRQFEEQFASRVGRSYGIAVCNGSAALEAAVLALGIGPGDEVIMPSLTIISCAIAVIRSGGVPVLVDSDPVTWNMDIASIETRITDKTKAIMVVHLYGLPVDMDPVIELASRYNLKIIEDAAEMHGQTYKGSPCGSFGDVSTFSFYPNKLITTGEGGMIVTDSIKIADHCRSLRNLCFQPQKRFIHDEIGFNFRMTSLQAALGLAQLERIDEFITIKRRTGKRYTELLSDISGLQLPLPDTSYADNIYWVFGIVLKEEVQIDSEQAISLLARMGVGARPFFWCLHEQPIFKQKGLFVDESYPVAERLARRGFYVPSGLALKDEQLVRVTEIIKNIMSEGYTGA